jgi:hypothetical protein
MTFRHGLPVRSQGIKSFSPILRRVTNPVEPLGFMFVQDRLPLSLLAGIRERFWKQADLFDHSNKSQVNVL